ncbi:aldo/keto reductase [Paraburkholderia dipogonis]|uniref:Aldo/keto reductase n=1 Tax=Paraburkholderia dipogonis TaxID=1211383 RepID=A0A4Y8MHF4_9BURK|nr:aldo/keto reductase [Paraburkholderia dipogonis]TFE36877.1 aldo/keto reductase [Paraburkholderia dipogonis]
MRTKTWKRQGSDALAFSTLGCGTAPLGNLYAAISDEEAHETLRTAWEAGMRYFDTAPQYGLGNAERRLGRFLRTVPRDQFVLSTKVGRLLKSCLPDQRLGIGKWFEVPSRREVFDYSYDGVLRSIEFSLERTGLDRFDIIFAHDLDAFTHGSTDARDHYIEQFVSGGYKALIDLREQGVISAIGAGVNEWQACSILAERCDMDLFLLAGRYTLLEQEPLTRLFPLCCDRGIGIVLGGAFNSGILATGAKAGAWFNYNPAPPEVLDRVRRIEEVCALHNVRLIEAALQFPLAHPAVVTLIPGAKNPTEARGALDLLHAKIPAAFWAELIVRELLDPAAPIPGDLR